MAADNPTIKQRVTEEMKSSMKAGDKDTLQFARNLLAAIKKKEIDDRTELDDAGAQKLIATAMKQRQESIDQFRKGNREDLASREEAELAFLKKFMPEQMGEAEVRKLVDDAVTQTGARDQKDMGKVMGVLMPKVQGRADGKLVNQLVRERLGQTS